MSSLTARRVRAALAAVLVLTLSQPRLAAQAQGTADPDQKGPL